MLTGSCLCSSVRITIHDTAPVMQEGLELCHCTDCRRFTGALAGSFLYVNPDNMTIKGQEEVKEYATTSDAGNTLTRYWCGKCGSSLYAATSREGCDTIDISAGESAQPEL